VRPGDIRGRPCDMTPARLGMSVLTPARRGRVGLQEAYVTRGRTLTRPSTGTSTSTTMRCETCRRSSRRSARCSERSRVPTMTSGASPWSHTAYVPLAPGSLRMCPAVVLGVPCVCVDEGACGADGGRVRADVGGPCASDGARSPHVQDGLVVTRRIPPQGSRDGRTFLPLLPFGSLPATVCATRPSRAALALRFHSVAAPPGAAAMPADRAPHQLCASLPRLYRLLPMAERCVAGHPHIMVVALIRSSTAFAFPDQIRCGRWLPRRWRTWPTSHRFSSSGA
jgi:hypothetical protein